MSKWDAIINPASRAGFDQAVMDARERGEEQIGSVVAELAADVFGTEEFAQLVRSIMVSSEAFAEPGTEIRHAGVIIVEGGLKVQLTIDVVEEGYEPACDHDHGESR